MKILGVSGGAGVMLHPFKEHLIGNYEIRKDFVTPDEIQWKLNFGDIPLFRTSDLDPKLKPDVIMSQANCGRYSVLSHSRTKTKKKLKTVDASLELFFNSIVLYKPKVFLLENLPALIQDINKIKLKRKFPNYKFVYHMGSVSEWGNSQVTRKRLILIGINKDYDISLKDFPVFKVNDLKNTSELLHDILDLNGKQEDHFGNINENDDEKSIAIFGGKQMTIGDIREEWCTRLKGQSRWFTTESDKVNFKTAPGVYRNLGGSYPATARKSNRQYDWYGNMMTPRQLARIQGVPDDFKIWTDFAGPKRLSSINKGRISVTKAPPYEIGQWFLESLKNINIEKIIKFKIKI